MDEEEVRGIYDSLADRYDQWYWQDEARSALVRAEDEAVAANFGFISRFQPTTSILDLGCGTGYARGLLPDPEVPYVGVDLSQRMLDLAQVKFPGERSVWLCSDLRWCRRFFPSKFDRIVSFWAMAHVPAEEALSAVRDLLRPGGRALIVVLEQGYHRSGHSMPGCSPTWSSAEIRPEALRLFPRVTMLGFWERSLDTVTDFHHARPDLLFGPPGARYTHIWLQLGG